MAADEMTACAGLESELTDRTEKRLPPRIQAFEFGDQSWLKGAWREAYLDGMNFMMWLGGVYGRLCEPFARWAHRAGGGTVLDLASGGGWPVETLVTEARKRNITLPRIILSDLHPDADSYARISAAHPDEISFVATPVDATHPGKPEARLFSICSAFHHLPPELARRVIGMAAREGDGIFIQEVFYRHWLAPCLSIFNLIPLMLAPFFTRRFSFKRFLVTTLVPIVPFMLMFDGVVSVFRSYSPDEILDMVPEDLRRQWRWETGYCQYMGILRAPYICGYRPATGFAPGLAENPVAQDASTAKACTENT